MNLISLSALIVVYFPGLSTDFLLPLTLNISAGACLLVLFHSPLSSHIESSSDRLVKAVPAEVPSVFHSNRLFISLLFLLKKRVVIDIGSHPSSPLKPRDPICLSENADWLSPRPCWTDFACFRWLFIKLPPRQKNKIYMGVCGNRKGPCDPHKSAGWRGLIWPRHCKSPLCNTSTRQTQKGPIRCNYTHVNL